MHVQMHYPDDIIDTRMLHAIEKTKHERHTNKRNRETYPSAFRACVSVLRVHPDAAAPVKPNVMASDATYRFPVQDTLPANDVWSMKSVAALAV